MVLDSRLSFTGPRNKRSSVTRSADAPLREVGRLRLFGAMSVQCDSMTRYEAWSLLASTPLKARERGRRTSLKVQYGSQFPAERYSFPSVSLRAGLDEQSERKKEGGGSGLLRLG